MSEFFAMGGYAAYVWSSFTLTVVVMAALFWQSWHAARKRGTELMDLREKRAATGPRSTRRLVAEAPSRAGETRTSGAN